MNERKTTLEAWAMLSRAVSHSWRAILRVFAPLFRPICDFFARCISTSSSEARRLLLFFGYLIPFCLSFLCGSQPSLSCGAAEPGGGHDSRALLSCVTTPTVLFSVDPSPILGGSVANEEGRMRLASALATWMESLDYLRPSTLADLRCASRRWERYWGSERDLRELDSEEMRRYLHHFHLHHQASTTNQERKLLAWFWHSELARDIHARDPLEGSPRYSEEPRVPRIMLPDEIRTLLEAADPELRCIIILALETGLRRGTLRQLEWQWVTPDGWLNIPGSAMKNHQPLRTPLSDLALQYLRARQAAISGRIFPISASCITRRFRRLSIRLHLDLTFHDARRTFFTRARQRGVPLEIAMALSGHSDIRTALRHYRALDPEELLRAVGREVGRRQSEV